MKTSLFLPVLMVCFFISSCNKETSNNNSSTPPVATSNDSVLLWKFIELDTSYTTPRDTTSKTIYTYDNTKRVSQAQQYIYNNSGSITTSYLITFVYNGADTLPVKIFKQDLSTNKSDTTYLIYNSGGFVIKDSTLKGNVIGGSGAVKSMVINITVLNDSIRNSYLYYNTAGTLITKDSTSRFQVKSGTDIVQEKVYSGVFLPNVLKLDFAFDTKINPLYKVTIHYPYYWIDDQVYRAQPHNYTDATVYLGTVFRRHLKYAYKYRSDNLPTEAAVSNTDITMPPDVTKVKYYYTK